MKGRMLIWLSMITVICAAALYALRVWRVGAGTPDGTKVLVAASVVAGLGLVGLGASARRRVRVAGVVLSMLGSLIVVCSSAAEYRMGTAAVASLGPDETVVIGSAKVTLCGFEASYAGQGELLEFRSNLIVDLGSGGRELTVVSGVPSRLEGYRIRQIGFDLAGGDSGKVLRTTLGFLDHRAGRPFIGGSAVLGMGVLVLLLPYRDAGRD